jgi:hypothetical protein
MQQGGRTQVRGLKRRDRCRMNAATRFAVVTLVDDAWSGSRGVDAVVTAFVLAASQPSVSAPSDDQTDPSPMRIVRACGDERVSCQRRRDTCFGSGRVTSAPAPLWSSGFVGSGAVPPELRCRTVKRNPAGWAMCSSWIDHLEGGSAPRWSVAVARLDW